LGKSVHQLPRVVTFAYDIRFRHTISHWKYLSEDYKYQKFHEEYILIATYPKKCHLGPQNGSGSLGPEKLLKIVNYKNCQKDVLSQLEKVGGH
jgi:hypothetical protein